MGFNNDAAELVIRITGTGDGNAVVAQLNQLLGDTKKKTKEADDSAKGWTVAIKEAHKSWAEILTGFNSAIGIVQTIAGTVRDVFQSARDAAAEQALGAMFERAFEGSERLAESLARATGGQLDDDKFQQLALKLREAGASAGEMERLLNLATKAANATGRDVAQTAEAFVASYAKGNDAAFKALGINLDIKKVYREHAQEVGRTSDELTIAEKRAILLEEAVAGVSKAFGDVDVTGTSIARLNQLQVRWNDFVDSVKGGILDVVEAPSSLMGAIAANLEVQGMGGNWLPEVPAVLKALADLQAQQERVAATERAAATASQERATALEDEYSKLVSSREEEIRHKQALADVALAHGDAATAARLNAEAQGLIQQRVGETTNSLQAQARATYDDITAYLQFVEIAAQLSNDIERLNEVQAVAASFNRRNWGGLDGQAPAQGRRGGGGSGGGLSFFEGAARGETVDTGFADAQREKLLADFADIERGLGEYEKALADIEKANDGLARFASGADQLTQSLQALASVGGDSLGRFLSVVQSDLMPAIGAFGQAREAGLGWGESFQKAAPGVISAIGAMGAAWMSDASARYLVLGFAEAAAAAASYPDVAGMTSHGTASATYFLAAALAGAGGGGGSGGGAGGGSRGRGRPDVSALFQSSRQVEQSGTSITINLDGANVFADDASTARKLSRLLEREVNRYKGASR